MADLKIEPMSERHIPGVLEIENEAFTTPWTYEMFRQEAEDNQLSRAYVALQRDRVVGYIVAWFLRDEVHLLNIAVADDRKRKGIGRRMMQFLVDKAKREFKNMITLEVRESNDVAIEMYRSFGFAPVGVRPNYYREEMEDAVLMVRSLSGWDERT